MDKVASKSESKADDFENFEKVKELLDRPDVNKSWSEAYSGSETADEVYKSIRTSDAVVYLGQTADTGFQNDREFISVDPWSNNGCNTLNSSEIESSEVCYVIKGSFAEMIASNNWKTERIPNNFAEENRDRESREIVEKGYEEVCRWTNSLAETEGLERVLLVNDFHYDIPDNAPVRFDYGNRRGNGEDSVYKGLLKEFQRQMEDHGMALEYANVEDGTAELYMES